MSFYKKIGIVVAQRIKHEDRAKYIIKILDYMHTQTDNAAVEQLE